MRRDDNGIDHLSGSAQGYLLTLRSMTGDGRTATISALARRTGVSTQAASEAVGRLAGDRLAALSGGRELSLTPRGQVAADAIFRRHALLEWLLTRIIGLGWAESDEEAMRLQGAVSPRVADRIDELLGHPETCPHGNPIDAAAARRRPAGIPLSEATPGTEVTIYRITEEAEEDAELLRYLEDHGLTPGTIARVTEISEGRDSLTIEGPLGRGTMGLRPAALIRVLAGRADPGLFHTVPGGLAASRPAPCRGRRRPATSRVPSC